jgi:hypothetical protein
MTVPTDDYAYLFAHVSLNDFLTYMNEWSADPAEPQHLADEWRSANAHFQELQQSESGWADRPAVGAIPKSLEPLIRQVAADPIFLRSFSAVPGEIGMVELDRLVASQKSVNFTHVARLKEELGPSPGADAVFRSCLPFNHPVPEYRVGRVGKDSYVFASESNDLRFLESVLLESDQLTGIRPHGPLAGVVGVLVGYGSNFLNCVALEDRLVLNNGFHRACALRALGVTHVPCVVQRLAGRADLEIVGRAAIRRDPNVYFGMARPPVMKDFFDPRLCRTVRRPHRSRQVRVTFTVEELDVP